MDKLSTKMKKDGLENKWYFPSVISEVSHVEWGLRGFLIYLGFMTNNGPGRLLLKKDLSSDSMMDCNPDLL